MNEFQHNEALGRAKFADFFKNKPYTVTFTEDEFDHKDAWVTSTNKKYAAEIKNRSPRYEKYDTYIMEKIKYDELERLYKENVTVDGIMAYFFDDTLYLFNLKKINKLIEKGRIKIEYAWLPDSTVAFKRNIQKPCYYLPKAYSYIYKKEDNEWKLISKP